MKDCRPGDTSFAKGAKFSLSQCSKNEFGQNKMHKIPYASTMRSLMYAQSITIGIRAKPRSGGSGVPAVTTVAVTNVAMINEDVVYDNWYRSQTSEWWSMDDGPGVPAMTNIAMTNVIVTNKDVGPYGGRLLWTEPIEDMRLVTH
ncbi:hypothetical protein CRG98_007593 [Punica granatum]|uniref:Uncharacterized protein n=1 Tax=Punica granatum TaxID=22663 RepID=A0A2I0KU89_PUNGR|nr:hypothetical protein CRG98_007593 [Punica granatum]